MRADRGGLPQDPNSQEHGLSPWHDLLPTGTSSSPEHISCCLSHHHNSEEGWRAPGLSWDRSGWCSALGRDSAVRVGRYYSGCCAPNTHE